MRTMSVTVEVLALCTVSHPYLEFGLGYLQIWLPDFSHKRERFFANSLQDSSSWIKAVVLYLKKQY